MVYFLRAGELVKIGFSSSMRGVRQRHSTILTSSPLPVELLGAVEGTEADEKRWHQRFAAQRAKGEWFTASPELLTAIEDVAKPVSATGPGPGHASFRWDAEFLARIDNARGLVSRSAWVRRAIEQALTGTLPAAAARRVVETGGRSEQPESGPRGRGYEPIPKGVYKR
jgi:Meiotically up-regulated gene 113